MFTSIWFSSVLTILSAIVIYVLMRLVFGRSARYIPLAPLVGAFLVSPWALGVSLAAAIHPLCILLDDKIAGIPRSERLKTAALILGAAYGVLLYGVSMSDQDSLIDAIKASDKRVTLLIASSGEVGKFVVDEYLACATQATSVLPLAMGRAPMPAPQRIPLDKCRENAITKAAEHGEEFHRQVLDEIAAVPAKFGEDKEIAVMIERYMIRWGTFWPADKPSV